ncbi:MULTISPECIES: glycerol-3-phosphate dehydrogenase [Pseudomonas]|uniref:Glycerol-3-phosphate dehydrogenase n=1 Tax=Pseudomonas nitroreducens TaxID=46680 RepID=A0A6G6ITI1_PSENT|nr:MULTISPECIES: glycerol-3-phosphate dehydrogenase [Pseudomonas]NMZ61526.1 glycerol-3-phosphate dehydrogenase [Pseudomonas nitroreducens]QIE86277.1 glycerol-3-phosphate dehydrogenase [Pseudomonas nitroreducens]UCL88532.1 glycerol-3-phosphate dehydrogenase [Pseudomonas sp. HS-18]WEX00561.1 glycerol-3-phosphate dehydrogenase [Pseudomonas nitroreducens]SNT50722.1 homodimeric glycerol 3-phosphate dehydrogenase (quinone) [Pseudomonas nitroreducens]
MNSTRSRHAPLAEVYDLAVVGGGINGAGIAADAAGRGMSVFLCEQHDLAAHTSSASSKLIHGGLRYLEHHEFRLVREALAEREVLLAKAPHIVHPLRFVLPHRPHLRPAWMIRAGLFLYDHLGKREKLPASRGVRFGIDSPLKAEITRGFEYSDCSVDDARLVVLNAMAARENGAHIHPHTRCVSARRSKGLWHLHLERRDGSLYSIRARALVNAAGPWVDRFLREELRQKPPYGIRLIQGSHLIVPRLYDGEHAYILQNEDRRIVFAIPYLRQFTLIGTTDREYQGDPAQISISEAETDYLLNVVNAHFKRQLSRQDILRSFSGVRPLCDDESDDPSAVTRDYTLALDNTPGEAPLLSVFGGKLTTYRKLAEAALEQLAPHFAGVMKASWTASSPLPGGEAMTTVEDLAIQLMERLRQLDPALARRWASTYGSRIWKLLDGAHNLSELGEHLGAGLYAREVEYLVREEWARDADDILWRRTKLGLFLNAQQQHQLQRYLTPESPALPSASIA